MTIEPHQQLGQLLWRWFTRPRQMWTVRRQLGYFYRNPDSW
jgi:hypothetical protein